MEKCFKKWSNKTSKPCYREFKDKLKSEFDLECYIEDCKLRGGAILFIVCRGKNSER